MKRISAEVWLLIAVATCATCFTTAGCELQKAIASPTQHTDYTQEISVIAGELATDAAPTTPVEPVSDVCSNCRGKGKVGDGTTMVTCAACNGTGKKVIADLIEKVDVLTRDREALETKITDLEFTLALANTSPPEKCGCQEGKPCKDCKCMELVKDVRYDKSGRYLLVNLEGKDVWLWQWKEPTLAAPKASPPTAPTPQPRSVLTAPTFQEGCDNGRCEIPMRRGLLRRGK